MYAALSDSVGPKFSGSGAVAAVASAEMISILWVWDACCQSEQFVVCTERVLVLLKNVA